MESIKIHFKPIEDKNLLTNSYDNYKNFDEEINKRKENPQKDIVLYIPLYYAFLFYYKNLEYFKHILVSTITFGNDFETITFNDKLIGSSLKAIKLNEVQDSQIKRGITYNSKKDLIPTNINGQFSPKKNLPFRKLATKNYTSFTNTLKNTFSNTLGNNSPKEEDKNCYNLNTVNTFSNMKNELLENILSNKKNKKKEEIIHLNRNKNRNNLYTICSLSEKKQKYEEEEIINNKNNNNYNNYNEYIFLWETNSKTFLVNIKMPMIYFKYKSIKNDIKAFCDKNLFLYIYQNNFINWDFYVLNFLFSIKTFRKIILKNYSLLNKFLLNDLFTKTINNNNLQSLTNNFLIMKNKKKSNNNKRYTSFFDGQKKYNIFDEEIIINKNQNKIYNILNENNESYLFFYTDNLYNNSIIKFYSYLITIDYDKLNPKTKWKYYLNFKQMNQLNEISKYESLDSFLPKIIKTDFQNGLLFMDFSLFDEFNIEILGYERKNIIKTNKLKNNTIGLNNTQVNDELCLDIKFPFVKVEKILNNNDSFDNNNNKTNINYIKNKVDLDINFLQRINKYRIDFWSKKILEIINNNYDNSLTLSSNLSPISTHKKLTTRNKKNIKISP